MGIFKIQKNYSCYTSKPVYTIKKTFSTVHFLVSAKFFSDRFDHRKTAEIAQKTPAFPIMHYSVIFLCSSLTVKLKKNQHFMFLIPPNMSNTTSLHLTSSVCACCNLQMDTDGEIVMGCNKCEGREKILFLLSENARVW